MNKFLLVRLARFLNLVQLLLDGDLGGVHEKQLHKSHH
jgi:hypothetical protein